MRFGGVQAVNNVNFSLQRARAALPDRPERRRQEHLLQVPHRPDPPRPFARPRLHPRPGRDRLARLRDRAPRRRHQDAGAVGDERPDRRGEPVAVGAPRRTAARRRGGRRRGASQQIALERDRRAAWSASSRTASASWSRSASCWRSGRGCCCSTSPRPASPAPRPTSSCASSTRSTEGHRSSSSTTTCSSCACSAAGSRCSTRARSCAKVRSTRCSPTRGARGLHREPREMSARRSAAAPIQRGRRGDGAGAPSGRRARGRRPARRLRPRAGAARRRRSSCARARRVGIVGHNGMGKTTFLKTLIGLRAGDRRPDLDRRRST